MKTQDYIDALGTYQAEPELNTLLLYIGEKKLPKIKRGERSANVLNHQMGIELAFTHAELLDVANREYPEGAIVLSSIFFYSGTDGKIKKFDGSLPLEIDFNMDLKKTKSLLGSPAFSNEYTGVSRWDFENYCIFVDFEDEKKISNVCIQLPIA